MATELYTPKEFAKVMGVSPQHILRCCQNGELSAVRLKAGDKRTRWAIPFDMDDLTKMAHMNAESIYERNGR